MVSEVIEYDQRGRMKFHPGYHFSHGERFTKQELAYLCKFYGIDQVATLGMAVGKTGPTIAAKMAELRKKGKIDDYRALWDQLYKSEEELDLQTFEEQPTTAERGRLLKTICVYSQGENGKMKHEVGFIISRGRPYADVEKVLAHDSKCKEARLSRYGQSLFDSCFRNW